MIRIGLGGWGDHEHLYTTPAQRKNKLSTYSSYFSLVEVDSTFYALLNQSVIAQWMTSTPDDFRFIFKAYQGMTGHRRGKFSEEEEQEWYARFIHAIEPARSTGKLWGILFQYPPWFNCTKEHVHQLRRVRHRMKDLPLILEFRHQSWFAEEMAERTLRFMEEQGWAHTVCDEPQVGKGSVPLVLHATSPYRALVRLHGRNIEGWQQSGQANWREVRYLYDYSEQELVEWLPRLAWLQQHSAEVGVIFNNNSGGHAAGNAKKLCTFLGMSCEGEQQDPPEQLSLF